MSEFHFRQERIKGQRMHPPYRPYPHRNPSKVIFRRYQFSHGSLPFHPLLLSGYVCPWNIWNEKAL